MDRTCGSLSSRENVMKFNELSDLVWSVTGLKEYSYSRY